MKLKEIYNQLFEDFGRWKSGKWLHYSDFEMMKLSTAKANRFHGDPIGIYLFPEEFTPHPSWRKKKYKFVVEVASDIAVFDFSELTQNKASDFIDKLDDRYGISDFAKKHTLPQLTTEKYWQRMFWEIINTVSPAKVTKFFMDNGYDAIFDDTKTIHSGEVQMVVFNVAKLKVIDLETNHVSIFMETQNLFDRVLNDLNKRNIKIIEVNTPKEKFSNWSNSNDVVGSIYYENGSIKLIGNGYNVIIYYVTDGERKSIQYDILKGEWVLGDGYNKFLKTLE